MIKYTHYLLQWSANGSDAAAMAWDAQTMHMHNTRLNAGKCPRDRRQAMPGHEQLTSFEALACKPV
jgi:hypothetical protein